MANFEVETDVVAASMAADDKIPFGDVSAGGWDTITPVALVGAAINVATAEASPDAADYIPVYDTSEGALNKVLVSSVLALGGALPAADTTAIVKGSADATKQLRFEVDGFTTGQTRVLTPPDQSGTLPLLERANTFTVGPQTVTPSGTQKGLVVNNTGTGDSVNVQVSSTDNFIIASNGHASFGNAARVDQFNGVANHTAGGASPGPFNVQHHFTGDLAAASGTERGLMVLTDYTHTGVGSASYFNATFESVIESGSTGPIGTMYGFNALATNEGSGAIGTMSGFYISAESYAGAHTTVVGAQGDAFLYGGSATNQAGIKTVSGVFGSGTSVTNLAGVDVTMLATAPATVTNLYGLKINPSDLSGATNHWNIYSQGVTSKNYFQGQIGLGVTAPNAAAQLQGDSTTQGWLPPRMTTTQRDAISSPPAGLTIYNTTTGTLNLYTSSWGAVGGGGGGLPGGTDTQVQFNDGGAFGGEAGLTYNKTTDTLTAVGSIISTATLIARQFGGVAGTDEVQIYHDGTESLFESKDGPIRLKSPYYQPVIFESVGGTDIGFRISNSPLGETILDLLDSPVTSYQSVRVRRIYFGSITDTSIEYGASGAIRVADDGTLGIGSILTRCLVEANTAGSGSPNILTAIESRTVLTNEGSTAQNYHTLPSAAAGLEFRFIVQDTDGIRVVAATGDTIRDVGTVSSAAGFIQSTTVGSVIHLIAINATEWIVVSKNGTWTIDS